MGAEAVIEAWMELFNRRRERGVSVAQKAQPDRAAALGALGEALVAGALRDLGWPILRNVVLRERGGSSEIDVIARAPAAIVVLEVKTWSGFIQGAARAESWTRRGRGDKAVLVPNAVRQNEAHVSVVERAIGDRGVSVWGLVVSAGHARFAQSLQPSVIQASDVGTVLQWKARNARVQSWRLQKAWDLLSHEAARSPERREAHIARLKARTGGD